METALRQRQHVLVDGSLSNGEWFSTVCASLARHVMSPHVVPALFTWTTVVNGMAWSAMLCYAQCTAPK